MARRWLCRIKGHDWDKLSMIVWGDKLYRHCYYCGVWRARAIEWDTPTRTVGVLEPAWFKVDGYGKRILRQCSQ